MVFVVVEAGNLQIAIRLGLDRFALLAILLGGYADLHVGVVVRLVEPDDAARLPVEVDHLRMCIVEVHIAAEGHREETLVYAPAAVSVSHVRDALSDTG